MFIHCRDSTCKLKPSTAQHTFSMMIGQRMSNYHHIIVPIDGSTPANKAADYAIELAGTQCRLTFVCAVDVNRIYGQTIRTPFSNPTPVIEANEKEAHRIVDALVSRATRIHRRANGMVMEGEPAVAVLQAAENIDADLNRLEFARA